jgi:hypothetical protein
MAVGKRKWANLMVEGVGIVFTGPLRPKYSIHRYMYTKALAKYVAIAKGVLGNIMNG